MDRIFKDNISEILLLWNILTEVKDEACSIASVSNQTVIEIRTTFTPILYFLPDPAYTDKKKHPKEIKHLTCQNTHLDFKKVDACSNAIRMLSSGSPGTSRDPNRYNLPTSPAKLYCNLSNKLALIMINLIFIFMRKFKSGKFHNIFMNPLKLYCYKKNFCTNINFPSCA